MKNRDRMIDTKPFGASFKDKKGKNSRAIQFEDGQKNRRKQSVGEL